MPKIVFLAVDFFFAEPFFPVPFFPAPFFPLPFFSSPLFVFVFAILSQFNGLTYLWYISLVDRIHAVQLLELDGKFL